MHKQIQTLNHKERASNFELCRLACMFYIVVFHLFIHNTDVTGGAYYNRALTTIFSIGVPVFVMISGFFKINASVKGFLNIVLQVLFYSVIADIICKFVFNEPLSTGNILGTLFPVTKTQYWFVSTYLLLYLISPFLNKFIDSMSKKEWLAYLITLSLLVCYVGGVMNQYDGNCSDRSIITFIYLYSIGRFIKIHDAFILDKVPSIAKYPWIVYIAFMIVFFVTVSFTPSMVSRGINYFVRAYNTIGLTLFSVLFFYYFKKLSIQKTWINAIAKSTFAIYLIHGNNIVTYHRWIYNPYARLGIMIDSIHLRFLYLLCSALVICLGCILIDQVRQFIFKYLGINLIVEMIDIFVSNKYTILTKNF